MRAGIHIFCPIAHGHHLASYGEISRLDRTFWRDQHHLILVRCDVLIVAQMDGWDSSKGIEDEVNTFVRLGRPIFDCDPITLTLSKRPREKPHRDRYDGTPTDEIAKLTNEYLEGNRQ